jgi:hypothetical protein
LNFEIRGVNAACRASLVVVFFQEMFLDHEHMTYLHLLFFDREAATDFCLRGEHQMSPIDRLGDSSFA